MVVVRRRALLAAASTFVVYAVLAACSNATAGQPKPTETGISPESTEVSTSESAAPEYSLARLCELVSADEAENLGGSAEGEEGNSLSDGHDICTWMGGTSLIVGFQAGTTTANADTGPTITNTPMTIDGLPAVQSLQTDTVVICEVMVDLPSGKMFTSSATVLSSGEGKYEPCAVAVELSNLIIPRVKDQ